MERSTGRRTIFFVLDVVWQAVHRDGHTVGVRVSSLSCPWEPHGHGVSLRYRVDLQDHRLHQPLQGLPHLLHLCVQGLYH